MVKEAMIYVIGSGPAGVACAVALVAKGYRVTMLDAGLKLEQDRAQVLGQLAAQEPAEWDTHALARIREHAPAGTSGIPLKYTYGSDFPYRETDTYIPTEAQNVGLVPSLARGGLSNVWGAAVLPYLDAEIKDWPIATHDLEPHYRSVLSFTGLAAREDDLASRFPLYSNEYAPLPPSRQIEAFLADLKRHRLALQESGFLFGYSRLAVRARSADRHACAACGLCMYGCPYGLIYNSADTLNELRRNASFTYIKDIIVERLTERDGIVRISARSRRDKAEHVFDAARVYVAAGVLSTTRLMLESLGAYDHPLTLRDSQYFLLPLLRYKGEADVFNEPLFTLSQAFIELTDLSISEHSVHLQIYTYNDLYREAIRNSLGAADALARPATRAFLKRFLLAQGYLHSDISPSIQVTLKAPAAGSASKLLLTGQSAPDPSETIKKVAAKLWRHRKQLRAVPLTPLLKIGEPGRGFHSGGTLPMRERPRDFETDTLGRPQGFQKVHVVDASTFPSIPATTITLTAMANAHRIASACDEPLS